MCLRLNLFLFAVTEHFSSSVQMLSGPAGAAAAAAAVAVVASALLRHKVAHPNITLLQGPSVGGCVAPAEMCQMTRCGGDASVYLNSSST